MYSYLLVALFFAAFSAVSSHPFPHGHHSHFLYPSGAPSSPPPSFSPVPSATTDDCSEPTPSTPPLPSSTPSSTPTPTPSPFSSPSSYPSPSPSPSTSTTPTSSATPTPTPSAAGSVAASSNGPFTGGVATYFYQNGNAGACGQVHSDYDMICAMDQGRFGTSGPSSPLCGQQVQITNLSNGQSVTVTIADDCPTCQNSNSIDLSVGAFQALSQLSVGEFPISWSFV